MLALGFKQCKYNAGMYYFINKETKELVIVIVYVNDVYVISSKDSLLFLELKQKFIIKWEYCNLEMYISYNCKNQKIFVK